jgi:hypothetical protein
MQEAECCKSNFSRNRKKQLTLTSYYGINQKNIVFAFSSIFAAFLSISQSQLRISVKSRYLGIVLTENVMRCRGGM